MNAVESPRPILLVSPWPSRNNGLSNYAGRYKTAIEHMGRVVETERLYFWGEKLSAWKWIKVLSHAKMVGATSVLIQHTPTCSGPFLPWFLSRARARGLRTAVVSHETPNTYARHLEKIPPLRNAYLAYERETARRASAFIVHTHIHQREMLKLGAPVAEVIPHAILNMPERILPRAPETIALYGQIGRKKGHDLVLDAVQSREPGTFPVLEVWGAPGVGQEKYLEELRAKVRADFSDRILFRGYLPDETKAEAFARMRLALFPYRWISQSGAMAEAVAHSVPYLASDIPFFTEFQATNGCGDLFSSDDSGHLAARMQELLIRESTWTPEDFAQVHRNLSIESCCARLLKHL
ncbi:MAG: glycosyltransferase [Fibrobacteres bacterium]|nr:glycosyltransferase [Fibrobacterota bacterium]